jgi:hypothetical protein
MNLASGTCRGAREASGHRSGADVARDTFQARLNTASESFRRVADQFTNVLGFLGADDRLRPAGLAYS